MLFRPVVDVLAWAAAASIIISSLSARRQDHLKRRLAFSTIGQLSYIVLGAALISPLSIMANDNHLLSVPCYNGTMLKQDYYNDFLKLGNKKLTSVSTS